MDLRSSERVYPITIGKAYDCDFVTVDKLEIRVSLRMVRPGEEPVRVWLDVDGGDKFTRQVKSSERLWVTEAMFDKAFYPFTITRIPGNGNRRCRSPLNHLKQAIEYYTQNDTE